MSSNSRKRRVEKRKKSFSLVDKIPKVKNKRNKTRKMEERKGKKKVLRKILTIILGLGIIGIFAITAFMIYIIISTGTFDPNKLANKDQTVLYDNKGEVFATLGVQKRESVTFDELPQVLVDAIVATEDSRYYQHNGVDMARFLKATVYQLVGKDVGGASTLTMQVVKNNLTDTTRSGLKGIIRKFKDVYLSVFFMEKKYSKEEIFEFYVNDSCLGGSVYGVEEASKYYFGKSVSEISLPEAALLAGMYQAPNRYNPYKNPDNAQERRNTVLKLMVRHGYITEEEKNMANAVTIESMLVGAKSDNNYQGYIDTVLDEVEDKTGDNPSVVPMKIYTALDRSIQDGIDDVLNGVSYKGWVNDDIQAGIAVTNVNDGTIVAIGAGRNRTGERTFNFATSANRQPGSTAKPIFDYGPGFEFNDFSTYTLFNDEPWSYTNGPQIGNWDGGYQGLLTLKQALSVSRNIPALKAFQQVDKKNIASFVTGLGINIAYSTKSDNYKKYDDGGDNLLNEAYSIGGMSHGVTPLDMAEAYACFANGGYHIEAHAVTKIEYRGTNKVVEFKENREKVMSDSTAYLMNNVLKYAVDYQFNGGAKVPGYTVAAKTGTSNLSDAECKAKGIPYGSVADLWTVAYTPEYSVALWYGYKETNSQHYLGSASAPKDDVMRHVILTIPKTKKTWEMPSSVVAVTVEKETWPAMLPSAYTPDDMKTVEYFKKGTQPTETEISPRYDKLPSVTNLKNTKVSNGYKLTWDFKEPDVVTDNYLNKYFSNEVYGKTSSTYLEGRKNWIKNVMGGLGFGIYEKSSTGELKQIDFVSSDKKEYIYKPNKSGNINIIVKAEYKNFKNNASDNATTTVKAESSTGTGEEKEKLVLTLNDASSISFVKGTYIEKSISITYNNSKVNNNDDDLTILYMVGNKTFTKVNELVEYINSLEAPDEIEITYKVTYKDITKSIKRKIKIIEG